MTSWQQLSDRAKSLGLDLKQAQIEKLKMYLRLLREANQITNLTAIREEAEQVRKLLGESLDFLRFFPQGTENVLDVGTGGGIPGIVLQIVRPELRLSLLDSSQKKCGFLQGAAQAMNLPLQVLSGRAETLAHEAQYREKFDAVVSRAVASLPVLLELAIPFLRVGGILVALKGKEAAGEISESIPASHELGGAEPSLRVLEEGLKFVVVEKKRLTPLRFPRRPGIPQKRPLWCQT